MCCAQAGLHQLACAGSGAGHNLRSAVIAEHHHVTCRQRGKRNIDPWHQGLAPVILQNKAGIK